MYTKKALFFFKFFFEQISTRACRDNRGICGSFYYSSKSNNSSKFNYSSKTHYVFVRIFSIITNSSG